MNSLRPAGSRLKRAACITPSDRHQPTKQGIDMSALHRQSNRNDADGSFATVDGEAGVHRQGFCGWAPRVPFVNLGCMIQGRTR